MSLSAEPVMPLPTEHAIPLPTEHAMPLSAEHAMPLSAEHAKPGLTPFRLRRQTEATYLQLMPYWIEGLVEHLEIVSLRSKAPLLVCNTQLCADVQSAVDKALQQHPCLQLPSVANYTLSDLLSPSLTFSPPQTPDLILLAPFLQQTFDAPGLLKQIYDALAPGGFFIASFFGQDTLSEFRACCASADMNHFGGVFQRFVPLIQTKDAGMLLQRAGFVGVTSDVDRLSFSVESVAALVGKLRDSGWTLGGAGIACPTLNPFDAVPQRRWTKPLLREVEALYREGYPAESGPASDAGSVPESQRRNHVESIAGPTTESGSASDAGSVPEPSGPHLPESSGPHLNVSVDLVYMCGWKANPDLVVLQ